MSAAKMSMGQMFFDEKSPNPNKTNEMIKMEIKLWQNNLNQINGFYDKHVTIVIYDRNDSGLYCNRVINYAPSSVALTLALLPS